MANDKISAMTAAVAADVGGSAGRIEMVKAYATVPTTLGLDFATLRTSMFAGGTGYTAADPLVCGTITASGALVASSAHHALGVGAALGYIGLRVTSSFTSDGGGNFVLGIDCDPTLTMAAGDTNYAAYFGVAGFGITTQGAGETIGHIAAARFSDPQITVGAGDTVSIAATVYIGSAPTEGVDNASLWVNAGDVYFGGTTDSSSSTTGALRVVGGLGVAKKLFVGTTANIGTALTVGTTAAVGTSPSTSIVVRANYASLDGVSQYGFYSDSTFSAAATTNVHAFYGEVKTANSGAPYTVTTAYGYRIAAPTLGTNCAITTMTGVRIANLGKAGITNAIGIDIAAQSGAATTNIGIQNAATSHLLGNVGIGKVSTATSPFCISGLPTSAAGLATGDVWSNGGVLTIV